MNDALFLQIKKEYDSFYRSLLKEGKLPMWSTCDMRVSSDIASEASFASHTNSLTSHGFWNASVSGEVYEAFKRMGLQRFKSFLDIGSGDGKVTLIASLFCRNSEGVEIDSLLHGKAIEMKNKLKINNAVFHNKDFFEHDFSKHDVLFMAPDSSLNAIETKLLREMKGRLIHYGHHFKPKFLKKEHEFLVDGNLISVYANQKP